MDVASEESVAAVFLRLDRLDIAVNHAGVGLVANVEGTEVGEFDRHAHELEDMMAELHARQPVGRMGRPEEIASLALYLASDEAAFTHGSVFTIDGGWTSVWSAGVVR